MSRSTFDTEFSLDLVVNLVPLSILLFFVGLFAVYNPWGVDPLQSTVQFAILASVIAALVIVTYAAARAIEADERRPEDERPEDTGG
ncbi:DUF6684 family protein [Natrialbaceae archaeon GCM10025810]|uniref:DUF6684 family protein n=1 Tax=Halovalidus salilacus TaxID=3075124 RepID=UPI003614F169